MASLSNPAVEIASQVASNTANAILPGSGAIIGDLENLFGAAHQAALAKEASTINAALPTWLNEVQQTFAALNSGAITEAQATAYINQAQNDYFTTVSGELNQNHGGPSTVNCSTSLKANGNEAYVYPQNQAVVNCHAPCSTDPNCGMSGACNAACCIYCTAIVPNSWGLLQVIGHHGGQWTIGATTANGAIKGTPAVTIVYAPKTAVSAVASAISSPLASAAAHPYVFAAIGIFVIAAIVAVKE